MKKYSTLKRLAAGAISAMMVFTSISAVFAAETTAAQTVTVETDKQLLGTISGVESTFKDNLFKTQYDSEEKATNLTFAVENGEKVTEVKDGKDCVLAYAPDMNKLADELLKHDKYEISFDLQLDGDYSGDDNWGDIYIFGNRKLDGTVTSGDANSHLARLRLWGKQMGFQTTGSGTQKNVSGIPKDTWYNIRYVVYLPKGENAKVTDATVEWYINDKRLSSEKHAADSVTNNVKNVLIPSKIYYLNGTHKVENVSTPNKTPFKIKNIQMHVGDEKQIDVNSALTQEVTLSEMNSKRFSYSTDDKSWFYMYRGSGNTTLTADNCIQYTNKNEGHLVTIADNILSNLFTGADKDLYKDIVFSYDIKVPDTSENTAITQDTNLGNYTALSQNVNGHQYCFNNVVFKDRIRFGNGYMGTDQTEKAIKPGQWYNIKFVITPSTTTGVAPYMKWYMDGQKVTEGAYDINQANTSLTGLITNIYSNSIGELEAKYKPSFNNFKLSVTKKSAHPDKAFNANVTKSGNSLNVVFNKDIANKNYITKNSVVVKANGKTAVEGTEVEYNAETKTATVKLPENSNADWYSVEIPDILTSTDSVYLTNNIVSTPHFAVDSAKIETTSNGDHNEHKLNVTYTNNTSDQQNVMVMLAAYDDGKLVQVDVKSYGVSVEQDKAITITDVGAPTIQTDLTDVRGYIWGANNCPIYNVVTLPEVK